MADGAVNLTRLSRKTHYWATLVVTVPVLVIVASGLLLLVKKHWAWVQPTEVRGTGISPRIDLEGILASVGTIPELGVEGWEHVRRIDVRPGRGLAKVLLQGGWEVQVDLGTGRVLKSARRRSDLIESVHDGSFFGGDAVRLGVFLPTALVLLGMWATGLWLFWRPLVRRRTRRSGPPLSPGPPPAGRRPS